MMTNHPSRNRLYVMPLGNWPSQGHLLGMPQSIEPKGYIYTTHYRVPTGVLVQHKSTGRYSIYMGGALTSVDQRKAAAALERMERIKDWKEMEPEDAPPQEE